MTSDNQHPDRSIIFLHGWLHSGSVWCKAPDNLPEQYTLFTPDLPGFGSCNAQTVTKLSLQGLASFVSEYITSCNLTSNPPLVVADSMSATVMLQLIQNRDFQKLRGLILVGCPSDGLPSWLRALDTLLPMSYLLRQAKQLPDGTIHWLLRYGNLVTMKNRKADIAPLVSGLRQANPDAAVHLLTELFDPVTIGEPVDTPVAVVRGEYDRIVSDKSSKALAKKLNAPYYVISGSGHTPMLEYPDLFYSTIDEIIRNFD